MVRVYPSSPHSQGLRPRVQASLRVFKTRHIHWLGDYTPVSVVSARPRTTRQCFQNQKSMYANVCLCVCLPASQPASLPGWLSACLPACLPVCLSLSVSVCLCLSLSVSVCLCLCLCLSLSVSVSLSVCPSVRLSVSGCMYVCMHVSMYARKCGLQVCTGCACMYKQVCVYVYM